jgi:hypothetical protein
MISKTGHRCIEVLAALRLFRVQRSTDDGPHVVSRVNADMRHTLGQSTRHVSGTNRTLGHAAQNPSP